MQRGRSTVYTLHARPVFVANDRRPVFTGEMLTSCEHLMAEICASLGGELPAPSRKRPGFRRRNA